MNMATAIQIFTLVLQKAPLAIETVASIRKTLAGDPAIPADLKAILLKTGANNAAALSEAQAWLAAHSE